MLNSKSLVSSGLLIFFTLLGFSSCGVTGSSGALPQAVIPNELITVSSPDADGNVTVTGAATSVGASSIVIAQVTAGTASNSSQHLVMPDWLISPAYATTCTSDLPLCPTLDEDGKCQDASDTTGAFVLTVPATSTSTLTISYIDSATCVETSTFESGIPDSSEIVALSLDVLSLAANDDTLPTIYLFGNTDDLSNTVHSFDLTTHAETTFDVSLTGNPYQSDVVTSADAVTRLVLTTDEQAASIVIDASGLLDSGNPFPFIDGIGESLPNLVPIGSHDFTAPDNLSSSCSTNLQSGTDYTRVYLHDDHKVFYANDLDSGHNNYNITSTAGTEFFGISFALSNGATPLTVQRIEYAYLIDAGTASSIFLVITPVEDNASYAFVINESDLQGCGGTTSLDISSGLELMRIGASGLKGVHIDNSASSNNYFSLFDSDAQTVTTIELASTASLVEQVDFSVDADLGYTVATLSTLYNSVSDQFEYLVIGSNTAGSTFYTQSGTSGFDTGDNAVTIVPKLIYFNPLDDTTATVIDFGNSGDGLSNVIFLDINAL